MEVTYSKVSGVCDIGGNKNIRIGNGLMSHEKIYKAQMIISLDKDNQFFIMKNKCGELGHATMDGALNIIANMITHAVFDGSMEMFQETMKMKIIESLKLIVSGNDVIPKGELNENTL